MTQQGTVETNLDKLDAAAKSAESINLTIEATCNGEAVDVIVNTWTAHTVWMEIRTRGQRYASPRHHKRGNSVSDAMKLVKGFIDPGSVQFQTLAVKSTKSAISGKELKNLALSCWYEALDMVRPSEQEEKAATQAAKQQKAARKDALIGYLKQGHEGIAQWNATSFQEIQDAGSFKSLDLQGADLQKWQVRGYLKGFVNYDHIDFRSCNFSQCNLNGVSMSNLDLRNSSFAGAQLRNTNWHNSKVQECDFSGADLSNASFPATNLSKTNLTNANLSEANLHSADLCGADLTNCNLANVHLEEARFDQLTKFPDGFEPTSALKWLGSGLDPRAAAEVSKLVAAGPIGLEQFVDNLCKNFEEAKIKKALKMLKAERFQLFTDVSDTSLVGVVKSQNDPDLVYSSRLTDDGSFSCCTQNLFPCGGLRGALCKHLLVLLIGMGKAGDIDPAKVVTWVIASKTKKPVLDKDVMSATFLRYKGAQAGEVDWRPTETVPEDYYAY